MLATRDGTESGLFPRPVPKVFMVPEHQISVGMEMNFAGFLDKAMGGSNNHPSSP
jgi:hypothetical protein